NKLKKAIKKYEINNGQTYFKKKIEKEVPYIIEMTPRLDGCHMWKLLKYYTGVNLIKLTFNHLLNNDISELNKLKEKQSEYELEFFCQIPNTIMNQETFSIPDNALERIF